MASNEQEKDQSKDKEKLPKEIESIVLYYSWEQSKKNLSEKKETSEKETIL